MVGLVRVKVARGSRKVTRRVCSMVGLLIVVRSADPTDGMICEGLNDGAGRGGLRLRVGDVGQIIHLRDGLAAAREFNEGVAVSFQRFGKVQAGQLGLTTRAAGITIDGRIAALGPRVNADVRFGQQAEGGHPLRRELVRNLLDQIGAAAFNGGANGRIDMIDIVEQMRRTVIQFNDAMKTNRVQGRILTGSTSRFTILRVDAQIP